MADDKQITEFRLEPDTHDFQKRMLFNRFAVVKDGDFRIAHFAYVSGADLLMDYFACAFHIDALEPQREENFAYLGRLPAPDPVQKWQPPPGERVGVVPVSHLGLARRNSEAEIILHN